MRPSIKNIVATAIFAVAAHGTCAHAGEGPYIPGFGQFSAYGTETLSFSNTLIGALSAVSVEVSQVDPAVLSSIQRSNGRYLSISIAAPVSAVSASVIGNAMVVDSVSTIGGVLQTAWDDGMTTTGGSLEITNLRVDLGDKKVFADLNGANGVGLVSNVHLWDIETITGATSIDVPAGIHTLNNELTGLKINADAFALFSQSLGLTVVGNHALSTVTNYGKITSTIMLVQPPLVPEPSTYAMMGAGLLTMLGCTRRGANRRWLELRTA